MASGEQIEVTYYLNDVSDDLSQVLMTYNDDGVYDTAYTYGAERIGIDILDNSRPDSQNPLYYLYDGQGSVSYITKPDGEIRDTYKYDEFGKPKTGKLSPDGDKILHTSFGYTGEQWDEESQLQYLRARYYAPEIGRFINRDTYEGEEDNPLSKNLYAYVLNNPINRIDPTGNVSNKVIYGKKVNGIKELKALSEIDVLARTIYAECNRLVPGGQEAVAWTIINRKNSSKGNSYKSIVFAKNQYVGLTGKGNGGKLAKAPDVKADTWKKALGIAEKISENRLTEIPNPIGKGKYFRSKKWFNEHSRILNGQKQLYTDKKWHNVKDVKTFGGNTYFNYA